MSKKSTITPTQIRAFWRAFSGACQTLGLAEKNEREEYRKMVLFDETQKEHLATLNRTTDYDRVMARLYSDSGDWQMASKYGVGDSHRLAVMIKICCLQIMQLKGVPVGSTAATDYLEGILSQAKIPCGVHTADSSFWMDLPHDSIKTVFMIVDTYRRRLLSRHLREGNRSFISFDTSVVYIPSDDGRITLRYDSSYYSSMRAVQVNVR